MQPLILSFQNGALLLMQLLLVAKLEPEVIVERLSSSPYVKECGYTAPAGTEILPNCSGEMYQRDDDKPDNCKRLDVYEEPDFSSLVEYYKGLWFEGGQRRSSC